MPDMLAPEAMKLSCTLLFLVASAAAQTSRVIPTGYDDIWASSYGLRAGFAMRNGIAQTLYTAPFAPGTQVQGVGFRRDLATRLDYPSVSVDFEISLSSTSVGVGSLSARFDYNRGRDHTAVLPRQIVSIPARAVISAPAAFVTLPTAPWTFAGANLLIECKAYNSGLSPAWYLDTTYERTAGGDAMNWGRSCSTAWASSYSSSSYLPSSPVTLQLRGARAQQPAIALLGVNLSRTIAGLPLPRDLGSIGLTGCLLLLDPMVQYATTTNGVGTAEVALSIPSVGVTGLAFGTQWLHADPAAGNALGVATTAGHLIRIGPIISSNRLAMHLNDPTAQVATLGWPGGPIARLVTVP
jgi:hypothetical protein